MNTTVLVVEDDLEINELLGEYLGLEDIRYLQATTGQAGIHQATKEHPDAIILDLMLPDIDGFEVARALTMRRATFDIPIIILTAMCLEGDREKGFGSGALFYLNKPFLPDDLLATLRKALDWKRSLLAREPAGAIRLGSTERCPCCQAINEMIADLYARTDLNDAAVAQIREALETLAQWSRDWNAAHAQASHLLIEYAVTTTGANGTAASLATVEWKLSEDAPGILTDAFFKPATTGGTNGGGLIGWGAGTLLTKPIAPIAPPAQWLQVLAKTGAARFEKDSKAHTVRFARNSSSKAPTIALNGLPTMTVPVVEIDGIRFPNRLRDEALAAKRK